MRATPCLLKAGDARASAATGKEQWVGRRASLSNVAHRMGACTRGQRYRPPPPWPSAKGFPRPAEA